MAKLSGKMGDINDMRGREEGRLKGIKKSGSRPNVPKELYVRDLQMPNQGNSSKWYRGAQPKETS